MKAISLWQPWASAIALGLKRIETRHWQTSYRGQIAIHAAKKWSLDQREFAAVERALGRGDARIALGAIVAVATLSDIRPTDELVIAINPVEKIYGNYDSGRFGWILDDVRALREPIPCMGRQSIWTLHDDMAAAIRDQI